jgi:hypothetical protein
VGEERGVEENRGEKREGKEMDRCPLTHGQTDAEILDVYPTFSIIFWLIVCPSISEDGA